MNGVVSRDVTGVQRDHHVQRTGRNAAYIAVLEGQAGVFKPCSSVIAQRDHVLAQLDAGYLPLRLQGIAQVIVNGEGQVALARAEICHLDRPISLSGDELNAWENTSMNLLICFHLRDMAGISSCCLLVTPRSARNGRVSSR